MDGAGRKDKLPPVVERRRVGAPVTAEMVAELRGGGKDFGSEGRGQRSEIREETSNGEAQSRKTQRREKSEELSVRSRAAQGG
jgi:hypothetical protein